MIPTNKELFAFSLNAAEANKVKPLIGLGCNKTEDAIMIHDNEGRCIVICHGISVFGFRTFLRDHLTVERIRNHFGIDKSEKVYLICCYGSKLRNKDSNTVVVNTYNRKCKLSMYKSLSTMVLSLFGGCNADDEEWNCRLTVPV